MKRLYLAVLVLIAPLVCTCSVTRSDFLLTASGVPDIVIRQGNQDLPGTVGSFDFDETEVYGTVEMPFTVENRGVLALRLRDIFFEQEDVIDYILDVSETDSLVLPGETTSFSVAFKPTREGLFNVVLGIMSNDPDESVYRFSLTGKGIPAIQMSPPAIRIKKGSQDLPPGSKFDFGKVQTGASGTETFTIKNVSTDQDGADLTIFSIIPVGGDTTVFNLMAPDDDTLSPGETATFAITFAPQTVRGDFAADIRILNNDPDKHDSAYILTVSGEGTAAPQPDISVWVGSREIPSGSEICDFGEIEKNSSPKTVDLEIRNSGTAVLNVEGITGTPVPPTDEISLSGLDVFPSPIPQGGSIFIKSTYTPGDDTGPRELDVTITSNDNDESPYTFRVIGKTVPGAVPDIVVKQEQTVVARDSLGFVFPDTVKGFNSIAEFTLLNRGRANLTIRHILVSTGDDHFDANGAPSFIPKNGGTGTFYVVFTPTESGIRIAEIEIGSDDPDEDPFTFRVKGRGVDKVDEGFPLITVGGKEYTSGSIFAFGEVNVGDSKKVTFTLRNVGTGELELDPPFTAGGGAPGRFNTDVDDEVELDMGESCTFTVSFTPTELEPQWTFLHLNGGFGEYTITLAGIGI